MPCKFDARLNCFKCTVEIRIGDRFKFILDEGRHFLVSSRYQVEKDAVGNENNVYNPKQIRLSSVERNNKLMSIQPQTHRNMHPYYQLSERNLERNFPMSERGYSDGKKYRSF